MSSKKERRRVKVRDYTMQSRAQGMSLTVTLGACLAIFAIMYFLIR